MIDHLTWGQVGNAAWIAAGVAVGWTFGRAIAEFALAAALTRIDRWIGDKL